MKKQIALNFVSKGLSQNSAQIKALATSLNQVITLTSKSSAVSAASARGMNTLALSVNKLALSSNRSITALKSMYATAEKGAVSSSNRTVGLGAMFYSLNMISDRLLMASGRAIQFGKDAVSGLTDIAFSFEYIKAGLDFAFGYKSQAVMKRALDVAQVTNISTREVLDVTRSLGVLKIDPFSEMVTKKGQIQTSLHSLADLAALVPQQGMEGALFAIRNALSGQWRSLQMRFDIPLNIIEDIRKNIVSTMGTQQRFDVIMQGITNHFGGLMSSVQNTSKFAIDNIKDIFINLMYDISKSMTPILTPFFVGIQNYLIRLRKDKTFVKDLSETVSSLASIFAKLGKAVFNFFTFFAQHQTWLKIAFVLGGIAVAAMGLTGILGKGVMMWYMYTLAMKSAVGAGQAVTASLGAIKWAALTSGVLTAVVVIGSLVAVLYQAFKNSEKLSDSMHALSLEETTQSIRKIEANQYETSSFIKQYQRGKIKDLPSWALKDMGESLQAAQNIGVRVPDELLNKLSLYQENGEIKVKTGASLHSSTERAEGVKEAQTLISRAHGLGIAQTNTIENRHLGSINLQTARKQLNSDWQNEQLQKTQAVKNISKKYGVTPENVSNQMTRLFNDYFTNTGPESEMLPSSSVLDERLSAGLGLAPVRRKGVSGGATGATGGAVFSEMGSYRNTLMTKPQLYNSIADMLLNKYPQGRGTQELGSLMNEIGFPITRTKSDLVTSSSPAGDLELAIQESAYQGQAGKDRVEKLLEKSIDNLEEITDSSSETAKNTKKVEELLPPIFREIFDKFTRRGMLASQGRAAFLGAR